MILNDSEHLTYCLNIHPGEEWEDQRRAIAGSACAVKAALAPERPFGLGLRIGARALAALAAPGAVADLRELLRRNGLYVFTVNAFPYGAFHNQPVKTAVYHPGWSDPARLDYTLGVAGVLAELLPEGVEGSISTVPLAYGDPTLSPGLLDQACGHLAAAAAALSEMERRTGHLIHLGLEPEPGCMLETSGGFIDFFERQLMPRGTGWLQRHCGLASEAAGEVLRRHLGICFDACHLAVQFESLPESLGELHRHGIRVSKVQLSAALETGTTESAAAALTPFMQDEVYLHQVRILHPGGFVESCSDLSPEFLVSWNEGAADLPCRIHFHVPLDFHGEGPLKSTTALLTPAFYDAARQAGATHFEIETYTFAVLPAALRQRSIEQHIIAEYRQVLPGLCRRQGRANRP